MRALAPPNTLALLATLVLLVGLSRPVAAAGVASVPELDLSRYAGQWHEIARLPMLFQRQCVADTTAQYTLRDDGLIGVRNACRTADGTLDASEGVARPVTGHPGRLQVRFAPDWLDWLPPVWADYWVIDLDPEYQWAVVGGPSRKYLWILSRTPQLPRAQFEQIKAHAQAMGYRLDDLIVAGRVD